MPQRISLRDRVAKVAVRSVNFASKKAGRGGGTVIGGRVGLALSPTLLNSLSNGRDVILVSGTNGKTTTAAMLATGWGDNVVSNNTGSNMMPGHVAALVSSKSQHVVLEVDERWLAKVAAATSPKIIVLLNLSRDQLDRASEVRQLAERWRTVVGDLPDTTIVANANDPLVVYAAENAKNVAWCDVPTPWTIDATSCPHCTKSLHFQEGNWWSECGFAKPTSLAARLRGGLKVGDQRLDFDLSLPGSFNESNAAMALCALSVLGIDLQQALLRIEGLENVAGRYSVRRWQGQTIQLMLAKNPAGFAAMLDTVPDDGADIWVAINARIADGHDPSWLYDVPFEKLRGHHVTCFGDRRLDLATRLNYGDVACSLHDDGEHRPTSEAPITVLANYTAFQDWRKQSIEC